jgi:acyl carrier protein phosphodiesterase
MNFLAHAHLSGNDEEIIFGNLIADSVKGDASLKFSGTILKGITLHRMIDTFTDSHPVHKHSRDMIREDFGKFSGIVIDIFYDHFLAANWHDFSEVPLKNFTARVYKILTKRFFILPARSKRILPFMMGQDWLTNYANYEGLDNIFYGMDRRTGLRSGMKDATDTLRKNYENLQKDFFEFYSDLEKYVKPFLDTEKPTDIANI